MLARKAWFLAGLLEWPLMAFSGVILGMVARELYPAVDPEMGLPMLVSQALPVGVAGLLLAARSAHAYGRLRGMFSSGKVLKHYLALAGGIVER